VKIKETTYKLRPGSTASDLDELDADLARLKILGKPNFSKLTYTIDKTKLSFQKARHLDRLMKQKKTRKIETVTHKKKMLSLKEFLKESEAYDPKEYAATKRDAKKLEMKCKKAEKLLKDISKDFEKIHGGAPISHTVLYNNKNKFKDLASSASVLFESWFDFLYEDGDYIK